MSESDSHENLHPRLSGSRFFICIRPARVERKCVPHFDFFSLIENMFRILFFSHSPSNFQRLGFVAVLIWVPLNSTVCSFPGDTGMCLALDCFSFSGELKNKQFEQKCSKSTDIIGDLHDWELVGLTKEKTESTILCKDSPIAYPETTKLSVKNRRFLKKGKQTNLKMLPLLD